MVGTTYSPVLGNLKSIPQVLPAATGQGIKGAGLQNRLSPEGVGLAP